MDYQELTVVLPRQYSFRTIDVENTWLVLTGSTDPDETNFDENATLTMGHVNTKTVRMFDIPKAAGGFTSTDITAPMHQLLCETQTVTVVWDKR